MNERIPALRDGQGIGVVEVLESGEARVLPARVGIWHGGEGHVGMQYFGKGDLMGSEVPANVQLALPELEELVLGHIEDGSLERLIAKEVEE